eukprot:CAMPEP_0185831812 /NCGR_PEP_ID=MMETSP1353-20130828/1719_1 /TAXON_ID=1077150 /ORGANISM="Erythrolobus australicus, Strain CCMP3124" /LENGTH=134 /DNA_ID=CAMNT_0028529921 /DNA_START=579 /DNA_END=979 /DNA_ORIENTATION=+
MQRRGGARSAFAEQKPGHSRSENHYSGHSQHALKAQWDKTLPQHHTRSVRGVRAPKEHLSSRHRGLELHHQVKLHLPSPRFRLTHALAFKSSFSRFPLALPSRRRLHSVLSSLTNSRRPTKTPSAATFIHARAT